MKTDTPMRTVTGWKFFGDLTVGDRLYDDRGLPCTVTDVTPARIPPLMFRLRYGNGTVLFVEGEQPLTCVHRETYYRWKKHREREEISDYYPADWVTALAEEETTEGLYDQVIAEGARPEQISWTQWMTQSPIMRLVPIAPPFEGITHPDLPDDAYQTGIDLISMAKDQALAPVNYIPREILNAPPAYREDVLRGLLRLPRGQQIVREDFLAVYRHATIIDDVSELIIGLGRSSYLEPQSNLFKHDERVVGVDKPLSVSARTGRFRTLHHRGPLHPGHIFLNSVRQVVPEEVCSVRVDSPSGMMLVGRGLVPLRGAR